MTTRATPLRPERTARILDAAQHLFARHGLARVSMEDIARDAGLAKPSLYYYFRTKEDLFRAVILREQREFTDAVSAVVAKDVPAADKLRAYVSRRLRYFRKVANLSMLSFQSVTDLDPLYADLQQALFSRELELVRRILSEGCARKEFRIRSIDAHASLLLHVLQGLRLRQLREILRGVDERRADRLYSELERETERLADVFVRALASGCETHAENGRRRRGSAASSQTTKSGR